MHSDYYEVEIAGYWCELGNEENKKLFLFTTVLGILHFISSTLV